MLSSADTHLPSVAQKLLKNNINFGFLVPTETALKKSIIDAHEALRQFLLENQIHDFGQQRQGTGNKILLSAEILTTDGVIPTKISLYRPDTKNGDPRIWVYSLSQYVQANNVIAVICADDKIFILNCSDQQLFDHYVNSDFFGKSESYVFSSIASELLDKLRVISKQGFVKTITPGDTGIGMTLEGLLGIGANSSKEPDYKGIELKSKRTRSKKKTKEQLFSKVPLWRNSPVSNAKDLINLRGYQDSDDHQAIRHTLSADKPNSLGLYLDIDYEAGLLKQMHRNKETGVDSYDVCWNLNELKEVLLKKHRETFWVLAKADTVDGVEAFHYVEATHTCGPDIEKFVTLLSMGLVTVDYTMHIKDSGQVRDHGYLFKVRPEAFNILFPEPKTYSLEV